MAKGKQSFGIEKNRLRNKSSRTLCKTNITRAEELIFAGDIENARIAVVAAVRTLDRAAQHGILHANNAARRKSRLMKKLNAALASAKAAPAQPA